MTDIVEIINTYEIHVPALDRMPDNNELDTAMKSIRRGISFDGLPPKTLRIFPLALKEVILLLMQRVFFGKFPKDWNKQMLHAVTKHGHTYNHPHLRGIAIDPLLCRLYDTIMDNRYRCWYVPNPEQPGFRPKQGCLLPLFSLVILIVFCKEHRRNLFVGLLDFEKVFDYVNRAKLLHDLMTTGCGKSYVRAPSKIYVESFYAPKIDSNQLGDSICTRYGVTQGRRTSTN